MYSGVEYVVCCYSECIAGQQLEQVTHISDLGIVVSSDLTWFTHIENIVAKANKTLGLIK